uniref:Retinol dehydrogenase 14 n=1 Tax=Aegilops tauschii subsp. strangulata TaxID=200361 RepID=A0A453QIA7_AEGTS
MTFATNYLGHFLLTELLLPAMADTARATGVQGRVVNVSSTVHAWFAADAGDDGPLAYLHRVTRKATPYDPTRAYALSKLANVLHTTALAGRLREMGADVTANCVHPGIVRTRLIRDRAGLVTNTVFFLASKLLKTVPQVSHSHFTSGSSADQQFLRRNPDPRVYVPGGGDDVLRGGAPGGGGGVGEVLRRLQRGGAVEVGVQRRGGLQAVELLRGHHRREGEGGECSSRHQLQVSGPELQRRPRHGHCIGIQAP